MSWNYRVVKKTGISRCGETWDSFGIHEVYYDEGKDEPRLVTTDPVAVEGDDVDDLREVYRMMKVAFNQPVLNYEDFNG